ncbi:MAG: hypothetical protein KBG01_03655 [Syntrophobacterales bacterium]|jgi:hypothetical protein|nr:hypothetical protein [Syntrophobacterales bacterium]
MTGRLLRVIVAVALTLLLAGCGGANLRYVQTAPEAKDFKPKKVALFPVDAGMYPEAQGAVEKVVAGVLSERRWFTHVASADAVRKLVETKEDFKQRYSEYMMKLKTVSFSDPELSKGIGEAIPADAFLFVTVEYWNYALQGDNKVAKVGMSMKLVEAATGKVVWKAAHEEVKGYKLIKPALADVARSLARDMISRMPH